MNDFINSSWSRLLLHNGLYDFDSFWNLRTEWFEEPNQCRGGWSGVSRCELSVPEGGTRAVFLKRQENHSTFSWRHPFVGVPTFEREFVWIHRYKTSGIPSLEPIYFATQQDGKQQRAILVTEELAGFSSMEERMGRWLAEGMPPRAVRLRYLRAIALLLRKMHDHDIQHTCFYPKHVFVQETDDHVEARVIDLEKSRWQPFKTLCALRDLDSLNRHSLGWSRADRMRFLLVYLGIDSLAPYAKWLWRRLARRVLRKAQPRAA